MLRNAFTTGNLWNINHLLNSGRLSRAEHATRSLFAKAGGHNALVREKVVPLAPRRSYSMVSQHCSWILGLKSLTLSSDLVAFTKPCLSLRLSFAIKKREKLKTWDSHRFQLRVAGELPTRARRLRAGGSQRAFLKFESLQIPA